MSKKELRSKGLDALAMLQHYGKNVGGSKSVLVISHYVPANDWFAMDDMLAFIDYANFKHILYFGESQSQDNEEWQEMVQEGRIIEIECSLSEYIVYLEENNLISVDELVLNRRNTKRVFVKNHSYLVPTEIYSEVDKQVILLDDSIMLEEIEEREIDFENFLGNSDLNPLWKGYAAGRRVMLLFCGLRRPALADVYPLAIVRALLQLRDRLCTSFFHRRLMKLPVNLLRIGFLFDFPALLCKNQHRKPALIFDIQIILLDHPVYPERNLL